MQGKIVGTVCGEGVAANPSHKRGVENRGGVENKSGNQKFHLQCPPRDRRGFGGSVGDVKRRDESLRGVSDYRNSATRGGGWLEIKVQRMRKDKALRRGESIESIIEGEALQDDGRGIHANNARVQRRSRVYCRRWGGGICRVKTERESMGESGLQGLGVGSKIR